MASLADFSRKGLSRSLQRTMNALSTAWGNLGINSGYRSAARNRKAGGAKRSQHIHGNAIDVDVSGMTNAEKAAFLRDAVRAGVKGVGIYQSGNVIHIDMRKNPATWGPSKKGKYKGVEVSQQPKWAQPALNAMFTGHFPEAPAAPAGPATQSSAGPWGASLAEAYSLAGNRRAREQGFRAPPAGRKLDVAPAPSPLSVGGLGASYGQMARDKRTAGLVNASPAARPAAAPRQARVAQPATPIAERFAPTPAINAVAQTATAPRPDFSAQLTAAQPRSPLNRAIEQDLAAKTMSQMLSGANQPLTPAAAAAPVTAPKARSVAAALPAQTSMVPTARPARYDISPSMQQAAPSPPIGRVSAPLDPRVSPAATVAQQKPTPVVRDEAVIGRARLADPSAVYARAPAPTLPAPKEVATRTVAEAPEVAVSKEIAQPATTQARAAKAAGIPTGVPGPWGADIANQPDPRTTGTIADPAHPPGFAGKLGDFAQRFGPQIAGGIIAGPVGAMLGGLLGRSFDEAKPGQILGNPFKGLGNTARALGMFQSAAPVYSGPRTTYGYGTRAIGDVLSGGAPVGAVAYSRSQPGVSYTTMPSGMVEKVNQYGFRSYQKPDQFSGSLFGGGGFSWGGGTGKSTSGKGGSKASGGGRAGVGAGHSKSSRF